MAVNGELGQKYRLSLLGSFRLERDGQPINGFESRKAVGVLGYLVAQGQPITRSRLADLFWPDKSEQRGRGNLSRVLTNLADLLPGCLESDYHSVCFCPSPYLQLDLADFADNLACGDVPALRQALQLYRGEFMAGLSLSGCPDFEVWLLAERECYARQITGLLETLITHSLRGDDYPTAQTLTVRLLEVNPALEAGHRQFMWLLAVTGQRQAALAHYQSCRRCLTEELFTPLSPETMTLHNLIQDGHETTVGPFFLNQRAPPPPALNPYRGLKTFTEADAPFFFGREAFVNRLTATLEEYPLVTVIGPSGSGKSSVVQAGVLPCLRRQGWLIASCRPGPDPFQALAEALVSLLPTAPPNPVETLSWQLATGQLTLAQWLTLANPFPADRPQLLLLDQFEELFTLCPDPLTRQRFLGLLLETTTDPFDTPFGRKAGHRRQTIEARPPTADDRPSIISTLPTLQSSNPPTPIPQSPSPISILLTLRADFMNQALAYRPLADALQQGGVILGPMNRQELSQAIIRPAEQLGVAFEPGLVERLLDDVGGEPGRLPLLEFALTSLWQQSPGGRLTHAAYQAIGQVQGALTRYAEQVYHHLSQAEQVQLPRLMARLVRFGDQAQDTRRPATRAELGQASWELAQKLVEARLLVTDYRPDGEETVEIVHEALLLYWDRLQEWLDQDRAFQLWQDELRLAVRRWRESGEHPDALLQGLPLNIAEMWLMTREADLSQAGRLFIQTSLQRQEREQLALRQVQHAQERLRRRITMGLAVGLMIALVLAGLAGWGWQRAMHMQRVSLSHQLAAQSLNHLTERQFDLALLLSLAANQTAQTIEARSSLLTALQQTSYRARLKDGDQPIETLTFTPDGDTLITLDAGGNMTGWDVPTLTSTVWPVPAGPVDRAALSQDGQTLALARPDGSIIVWNITGQRQLASLPGPAAPVDSLAFSQDGHWLISGGSDQTVSFWPLNPPPTQVRGSAPAANSRWTTGHYGQLSSLALSPDGRLIATGSRSENWHGGDNQVLLWQANTGHLSGQLGLPERVEVSSLAFNPEGRLLAVGQTNGVISLWQPDTQQHQADLLGYASVWPVVVHDFRLAFSPDGQILASADSVGTIMLWDVASRQPLGEPLAGPAGPVNSLAFSPDGQILASAGVDGTVVLWNTGQMLMQPLAFASLHFSSLAVSPDTSQEAGGRLIAAGSDNGRVLLWERRSRRLVQQLRLGHEVGLNSLAFSPDGHLLAAGNESHVLLWDMTATSPVLLELAGHTQGVNSVAFSPDSRRLVSGSLDGTLILWDVSTGQPLDRPLSGHTDGVWEVAFSPDGFILASASWDGAIRLWDTTTGQPLGSPLIGHTGAVVSLAYSPDGRLLASGGRDKTIRLWDMANRQPVGDPLLGHRDTVWSVAFSPDGQRLASSGCGQSDSQQICRQGEVWLWDVASARPMGQPFTGHKDVVWNVAFTPDNRTLVSSGDDGAVLMWQVDETAWQTLACTIANRNLTPREWEQYLGNEPYWNVCPITDH